MAKKNAAQSTEPAEEKLQLAQPGKQLVWMVRPGTMLTHPKSSATVGYAGEYIARDHPFAVAFPETMQRDCLHVEIDEGPLPELICERQARELKEQPNATFAEAPNAPRGVDTAPSEGASAS